MQLTNACGSNCCFLILFTTFVVDYLRTAVYVHSALWFSHDELAFTTNHSSNNGIQKV